MNEIMRAEGVSKSFPVVSGFLRKQVGEIRAVDNVSFTLDRGQVLGIVGESGSGKSTLARTVLRLIEPTSGKIYFDGVDLSSLSREALRKERKKMQMVFQNPALSLNPRKTVRETIGEVLRVHNIVPQEEEIPYTEKLLERVGLDHDLLSRYPHELSIGQKQRVAIGRAISTGPSLLVLDECVSALDISIQAQVLNLLQELLGSLGMSYLFISHDLTVVEHLADTILVMLEGRVVEMGPCDQILENPQHPYTQRLLSAALSTHPRARTVK
jgi:ABC-type oligopeptide transport system ATPase subunit